jgi:hypothetical protein
MRKRRRRVAQPGDAVTNVSVEGYAGYKGDERPLRLKLNEKVLEIAEVEDRWYSPGQTYFRVRAEDGDRYLLRHVEAQDVWSLEGYRSRAQK